MPAAKLYRVHRYVTSAAMGKEVLSDERDPFDFAGKILERMENEIHRGHIVITQVETEWSKV